jgi:hypothetical protein
MAATAGSWTGFWTGVYFGATAAFCAGRRGEAAVDSRDRAILRRLAGRVRRIADRSREREKRELWYAHNALRERYPVVLCDPENGWNEIITGGQLECAGSLARRWEWVLRRQVFWGETLLDDRPIEPVFEIGTTHTAGRTRGSRRSRSPLTSRRSPSRGSTWIARRLSRPWTRPGRSSTERSR